MLSRLQCSQARVRWPFCPLLPMAWHTTAHTRVSPGLTQCEGSHETQHLLPFSQGLSRAAPVPWPGLACQSRQSRWPRPWWQNAASRQVEEPWVPAGLCELSLSDLRRRPASLEIALQRRVGVGRHSASPVGPAGSSGLQWLQVLDAQVCEGDSDC